MSNYFWSEENTNGLAMGKYLTKVEYAFLLNQLKGKPKDIKILDIGGGDGRFALRLNSEGFKVDILEYDTLPLDELKEKNYPFKLIKGDGNKLSQYFNNNEYDVILVFQVLECVERKQISDFLNGAFQILKPNGLLILTTDNLFSLQGLAKLILRNRKRSIYKTYSQSYFSVKNKIRKLYKINKCVGYRYAPLKRKSTNIFILRIFYFIEKYLFFNKIPFIAPWNIWAISKR